MSNYGRIGLCETSRTRSNYFVFSLGIAPLSCNSILLRSAMGRLVRSRLKAGINLRRDSYFLVVSCTSLLLYAICLYTFLHLNGYIGAKGSVPQSSSSVAAGTRLDQSVDDKNAAFAATYLKSQAHFDDGKIHEFQRNIGHPVDWEMRVKGNAT